MNKESEKQQQLILDYIKQDHHSLLAIAYWMGVKKGIQKESKSLDLDKLVKCGKCIIHTQADDKKR